MNFKLETLKAFITMSPLFHLVSLTWRASGTSILSGMCDHTSLIGKVLIFSQVRDIRGEITETKHPPYKYIL